jgi:serine/threonine protein kinase
MRTMDKLDVIGWDPTMLLSNHLGGLISKLGARFGCVSSLSALLQLLEAAVPRLLLLSDGVPPQDIELLRQRFPGLKLVVIYRVAPAVDFTEAAAAILTAVRLDTLRWKLAHSRKLLKDFVCEYVLAPRRGLEIDGYRLEVKLGQGGFGEVWRGVRMSTGTPVAIKVVKDFVRVRQERQSLSKYENLVGEGGAGLMPVHHSHHIGTRLFIVMPLADLIEVGGERKAASLEALLEQRGGPLDLGEALRIVAGVLRGLVTLHSAGLLHGDPSLVNVLAFKGQYLLADPGLVRFVGDFGRWANEDFYPRPRTGRPSDDLHAVGVILHALLTGETQPKLEALTLQNYERSQLPVFQIIAKACNRNSEQRYESAVDMLANVELALPRAPEKPPAN